MHDVELINARLQMEGEGSERKNGLVCQAQSVLRRNFNYHSLRRHLTSRYR